MALFSKLKERLLKSSSRLGKEVDAIVEEGAVTPDPAAETTPDPAPAQKTQPRWSQSHGRQCRRHGKNVPSRYLTGPMSGILAYE